MNDSQEDFRSMALATQTICITSQTIWNTDTVFSANFNTLGLLITDLDIERLIQETDNTGIAIDKKKSKTKLIVSVIAHVAGLKSYAADTDNDALYQSINYTKSHLEGARDTILIDKSKVVRDTANTHLANLGNYNINAATITALNLLIATYAAQQPAPTAARATTKQATARINAIIKTMRAHLERKLDNNIERYKTTKFYGAYKNARTIINTGKGGSGIKGTGTDQDTKEKLKGVLVKNLQTQRTRRTNTEGNYTFKKEKDGTFDYEMSKRNYVKQTYKGIVILKNKVTDFDFTLKRVATPSPSPA